MKTQRQNELQSNQVYKAITVVFIIQAKTKWHFIQNFTSKMKKEKILKTQTKGQVAFVQSSLTSKNYSLYCETSFKTFDSFLSNLKQKQKGTSSKILHPK